VGIALAGQRHPRFWSGEEREAKFDIQDLKGVVEGFFEQFGVRGVGFIRRPKATRLFAESATMQLGREEIGELGWVLPALGKLYDLRATAMMAELNLDLVLTRRNPAKSFRSLPAFPSIRRDVAMVVPEGVAHEAIVKVARETKAAGLEAIELFDVFRGGNVPQGQKSMAYALTYRASDRTLTDAEVNAEHQKVVAAFKERLRAAIRE
jgi:phenylalanyl-tRNA synthetase beta chain